MKERPRLLTKRINPPNSLELQQMPTKPREVKPALVLRRLIVPNRVEEAELTAADMTVAKRNTAERFAVVEDEQLGEVMCFELGSVVGRGFDGARFARPRVQQVVEATKTVSAN
jgi:hypothetical protein